MFKSFAGLALALPALATSVANNLAETQCHAVTTDSFTIFNIEGIENKTGDYTDDSLGGDLKYNYCTFVTGTQAYATLT